MKSEKASRKLIMIGGTSYSGSTMLELILANQSNSFSCGEVWSLFHPHKSHHFNPTFPVKDQDPDFWNEVRQNGSDHLFISILDKKPDVELVTDNTKRPFWQLKQVRRAKKSGFDCRHVLIWKSPEELSASFRKRGRGDIWAKKWINYHIQYFSLIPDFVAVEYQALVNNPDTLEALCKILDLPFSENKHEYWVRKHYTLQGNKSAKIHLFDKNSEDYKRVSDKIQTDVKIESNNSHRAVVYSSPTTNEEDSVLKQVKAHPAYDSIIKMLKAYDVSNYDQRMLVKSKISLPYLPKWKLALKGLVFDIFLFATSVNLFLYRTFGLKLSLSRPNAE